MYYELVLQWSSDYNAPFCTLVMFMANIFLHDKAAGYNLHGNEKNSYHIKTRKVQKLEHEVNHKDGRSEDSYWNNQHNQGQYGLHGAYQNAGHAASRDHAYNYNHQAAYQPYYSHALY